MKIAPQGVTLTASAVVILMLLFPPWHVNIPEIGTLNLGYYLVAAPPRKGEVDLVLLLIQIAIVALTAFSLVKILMRPR